MECVTTAFYSFLVNRVPTEFLMPSRGLRQGDPLSPYLFLLCAEGLGAMINHTYSFGLLWGISIARDAPPITHLFFTDDSIIFTQASYNDAVVVSNILRKYKDLSRQKINLDKCEISFSNKLLSHCRQEIKNVLGFVEVSYHGKYLGLPMVFDKSKKVSFASVKDRVSKKLQGWKENLLSRAGKEILIKAIVQAIPTFAMSCFKLPTGLCKDIESLICRFGGEFLKRGKLFIGNPGLIFVILRIVKVWDLEISRSSIKPCWLSNFGGSIVIGIFY